MPKLPSMTRRDFEFIADVIARLDLTTSTRAQVAAAFAGRLKATNGSFQTERFIAACNVKEED